MGGTMILRVCLLLVALMAAESTASMDKQTYIIHMDRTKISATYHSLGNSGKWYYESVMDSISQLEEPDETAPPDQLIYVHETAISGFAAKLSSKQVEALSKTNGFISAIPDELLTLHTTHIPLSLLDSKVGKVFGVQRTWVRM